VTGMADDPGNVLFIRVGDAAIHKPAKEIGSD